MPGQAQGARPGQGPRRHARARMVADRCSRERRGNTVQYPHEKEAPPIRARGVIALREDNCTVCMLCARCCPDWCIYIEGHKELAPPRRAGGKPRTVNKLDRFDIDYALCMYCGICVEVCPFDALFWSPEYEYSEPRIADLLHDKDEARRVDGDRARGPRARGRRREEGQEVMLAARRVVAQNIALRHHRRGDDRRRHPRRHRRTTSCTPRCGSCVVLGRRRRAVPPARRRVRRRHPGARLHRRGHGAVPVRHHAHPRPDRPRDATSTTAAGAVGIPVALLLLGVLVYVADRRVRATTSCPTDPAPISHRSRSATASSGRT